ncbi:hypothetical protein V1273_001801 [Bradyrhizobium sp. AZCC 1721]
MRRLFLQLMEMAGVSPLLLEGKQAPAPVQVQQPATSTEKSRQPSKSYCILD